MQCAAMATQVSYCCVLGGWVGGWWAMKEAPWPHAHQTLQSTAQLYRGGGD